MYKSYKQKPSDYYNQELDQMDMDQPRMNSQLFQIRRTKEYQKKQLQSMLYRVRNRIIRVNNQSNRAKKNIKINQQKIKLAKICRDFKHSQKFKQQKLAQTRQLNNVILGNVFKEKKRTTFHRKNKIVQQINRNKYRQAKQLRAQSALTEDAIKQNKSLQRYNKKLIHDYILNTKERVLSSQQTLRKQKEQRMKLLNYQLNKDYQNNIFRANRVLSQLEQIQLGCLKQLQKSQRKEILLQKKYNRLINS